VDFRKPSNTGDRPSAGVPFMEDQVAWHYRVPSAAELAQAFDVLGVAPLHKG
jgi:hypothetical protein